MNATRWLWLSLLATFFAMGCGEDPKSPEGGDGGAGGGGPEPGVARVEVTPAQAHLLVGEELQLEAQAFDAAGKEIEARLEWASTDTDVAVVSPQGVVLALARGIAGIQVSAGDQVEVVTLRVEKRGAKLELPDHLEVGIGQTVDLGLIFEDEDGEPLSLDRVEWTVSQPGVVTVQRDGFVQAIGRGETTLTATADDLEASVEIRTLLRFSQMSLGDGHTCGLTPMGEVFCWGTASEGRLGFESGESFLPVPRSRVVGELWFARIAAGARHTCGLDEEGAAHCWGRAAEGQLGRGGVNAATGPLAVPGVPPLVDLDAQHDRTCGLDEVGTVHCWGGTAGEGPAPVEAPIAFQRVAVGRDHVCGLGEAGEVHCWGSNERGQLGSAPSTGSETPVEVEGLPALSALEAGAYHTCGLGAEDRRVYCWGGNESGELGRDEVGLWGEPAPTAIGYPFLNLSLGGELSCGISTGGAFCWGANDLLQVGSTSDDPVVPVPTKVGPGPWTFQRVAAGASHACALDPRGEAYCWGDNRSGQLGSDTCDELTGPCFINMPHLVSGQR